MRCRNRSGFSPMPLISFADRCVGGIRAYAARIHELMERSVMLVTACSAYRV
jgi:fumarate hydratase class II